MALRALASMDNPCATEHMDVFVLEMLCGTMAAALESADPRDVRRATEIIDLAAERTLEHLRLACEMARRIHGEDDAPRRAYG